MTEALHGVNLGGWLVVEKWMTPSLFAGMAATNEYELSKLASGQTRLKHHHQTFIAEEDILWLKDKNISIVRVPIGYWIFGNARHYIGAIERLDWLMEITASLGMKVLLDLHGAPGAQNASEHSGSGNAPYRSNWLYNRSNQDESIKVLVRLAQRYQKAPNLWGIELLNEPAPGLTGLRLAWFYRRAYREVIKVARPGTFIVFSDGYAPLRLLNTFGLIKRKDFPVAMDCHFYYCFGAKSRGRTFEQQLRRVHNSGRFIKFLTLFQPVVVGEWSAMLPYRIAEENTDKFVQAQHTAYQPALAHFYWNYKTEPSGRWNFRHQNGG